MADEALHEAIDLAKSHGSQIILLTILQSPNLPSLRGFMGTTEIRKVKKSVKESMNILKKETENMLKKKSDEVSRKGIRVSKQIVVADNVAEQIIQFAKDNNVDVIIIGSRRFKGMSRLKSLGSVARKVADEAKCPVLIMR